MNRDKIQYIFMILVGVILLVIIALVGFYFWKQHSSWQKLLNDPTKGKFASQIDTLEKKSDKTSDDYLNIGNDYSSLADYPDAIVAFQKAIDLGSYDVGEENLAIAYTANGDFKDAEKAYQTLVDKKLATVDIYMKFADLYKNNWPEKSNSTIGILKEAEAVYPNSYDLLVDMAEYYVGIVDKSDALIYYNKALKIEPDNTALKNEMKAATGG